MNEIRSQSSLLQARALSVAFNGKPVLHGLNLVVPENRFTAIIGSNGCGKSTLLKALARILKPDTGEVLLDGRPILAQPSRSVARRLALLPQTSFAPEGILVADLVGRGRFPHRQWFRPTAMKDTAAIDRALQLAGIEDLAGQRVDELSGGQRQRVWIAMALAQETPLLLLDEPTTFLDIVHQIELMELFSALTRHDGRTIVAVLHDLNQVGRYADHVVAMKSGLIVAEGPPKEVMTAEFLHDVFGLNAKVIPDPFTKAPMIIPEPLSPAWQENMEAAS